MTNFIMPAVFRQSYYENIFDDCIAELEVFLYEFVAMFFTLGYTGGAVFS